MKLAGMLEAHSMRLGNSVNESLGMAGSSSLYWYISHMAM